MNEGASNDPPQDFSAYWSRIIYPADIVNGNRCRWEFRCSVRVHFFSGTASLVYLAIAAVVLWRLGHKFIALALPITSLATGTTIFMTQNPSELNIVFNAIRVISFVTYFYATWLLYVSDGKRSLQ